jgi:hypothetical protein
MRLGQQLPEIVIAIASHVEGVFVITNMMPLDRIDV